MLFVLLCIVLLGALPSNVIFGLFWFILCYAICHIIFMCSIRIAIICSKHINLQNHSNFTKTSLNKFSVINKDGIVPDPLTMTTIAPRLPCYCWIITRIDHEQLLVIWPWLISLIIYISIQKLISLIKYILIRSSCRS